MLTGFTSALAAGDFVKVTFDIKGGPSYVAEAIIILTGTINQTIGTITSPGESWVARTFYAQSLYANIGMFFLPTSDISDTVYYLIDNATVEVITLPSILALSDFGFSGGRFKATFGTVAAGEMAGLVILANDSTASTDGVFGIIDRSTGKLHVYKRVAGTDTTLINETVTYNDGDVGWLVFDRAEQTLDAFFDNAKVGETADLGDASIIDTSHHGILLTGGATMDAIDFKELGYDENLLTNGNMESGFTSGLADGWTKEGGNQTFTEETTIVFEGSSAQKVTVVDDGQGIGIKQSASIVTGQIYRFERTIYANSERTYSDNYTNLSPTAHNNTVPATTQTTIVSYLIGTATGAGTQFFFYSTGNCTTDDIIILDALSLRQVR